MEPTTKDTPKASLPPSIPAIRSQKQEDDGWDYNWDATHQAYYFYNRFTRQTTWKNPRVPSVATDTQTDRETHHIRASIKADTQVSISEEIPSNVLNEAVLPLLPQTCLPAGGYNPAIHGSYDPNAWYAKAQAAAEEAEEQANSRAQAAAELDAATGTFNRFTGRFQLQITNDTSSFSLAECGSCEVQSDEAKSRRQLNSFFDVDAAANQHDGRSLRAERSGIRPSKNELKRFKERRRAKKEEKRRAWLKE